MSAYLMAGLRSLLLILIICEFFCVGIVIVDNCCNGAVMSGVMPEISKMLAVLDALAGNTASTINGAISSAFFFKPEYLIRGCDVFGTVANSN